MGVFKLSKISPYYLMGIFFAVAQMFIFSALLFDVSTQPFLLWSCNNFCILLVIACYRKDMQMIMGISYLGLVSQIIWILDFSSHLLGFDLSGVTDYIYTEGFTYANEVSIGIHIMVPIAILLFSFRVKPKLRSLAIAFPYIVFLYIATILWTPAYEDINCVFRGCGNDTYLSYNVLLWPLYAVCSTLLAYAIHYGLYYSWRRAKAVLSYLKYKHI